MNDWLDYRYPRGGVAFIAGLYMLVGGIFVFYADNWILRGACMVAFPVGVGLWLKHSWARWTMFTLLAVTFPLGVLFFFLDGFSIRLVARMITSAWMMYALWEWDVYPESEKQFGFRMPDDDDDVALNDE